MRYFEDIPVGETAEVGAYEVTAEEIVEYARQHDPLPFHTDAEAAKDYKFAGGLIASGWHLCAIQMRMIYDHVIKNMASMGSFGLEFVQWRRPVRPGDVLSLRYEIMEKRTSKSKPSMGIVKVHWEIFDQTGEVKAITEGAQLVTVREPVA
ncbi:MAG: MaoC family dehydratase [Hyphomicrobiales bacterium]